MDSSKETNPGLFEPTAALSYTKEQNDAIHNKSRQFQRIAQSHPLPPGMSLEHSHSGGYYKDGRIGSTYLHTTRLLGSQGEEVGSVQWHPKTGSVAWLGMETNKHLLPHLLGEAADWAHKEGVAPPTHADSLTDYSYRTASRHSPQFLSDSDEVHGLPVRFLNQHTASFTQGLAQKAASLHTEHRLKADSSGVQLTEKEERAHAQLQSALDGATKSAKAQRYLDYGRHMQNAVDASDTLKGYLDYGRGAVDAVDSLSTSASEIRSSLRGALYRGEF